MTNYKNGRIYKILNTIDDNVYVGSTTEALCKRMWKHKWDVKNNRFITRPLYVKAKEYGFDNFYIELIENYPCECKEEMIAREGYWIRQIGTLNAIVAGRTPKEYYEDNKETKQTKSHDYYHTNHYKLLAKRKEFRDNNQELIREQNRQYRETHNNIIPCDKCGCLIQSRGMPRHQATLKCRNIRDTASNISTSAGSDE